MRPLKSQCVQQKKPVTVALSSLSAAWCSVKGCVPSNVPASLTNTSSFPLNNSTQMEGYFNYQLLWQCDLLSSVSTRSAPTTSPSSASSSSASTISINSPHQTIQKPHPLLAANRKPFTHRPANDRANWTVGDRLQLINVTFEGGDGWDRVASNLKRSVRACQNKYNQIFLAAGARKEWTDEEYSIACYLRSLGCQYVHIARWVPHSPAHIRELDMYVSCLFS